MRPKKWRNAHRRAKPVYFEHPAKLAYFDEHPLPCGSLQAGWVPMQCKSWD